MNVLNNPWLIGTVALILFMFAGAIAATRHRKDRHPYQGRRRTRQDVGLLGSAPLRHKRDDNNGAGSHYYAGLVAAAPWLRIGLLIALLIAVDVPPWSDPACMSQLEVMQP